MEDVNKNGLKCSTRVPPSPGGSTGTGRHPDHHRDVRVVKFKDGHSVIPPVVAAPLEDGYERITSSDMKPNSLILWENYRDSTAYLYDYLLELSREDDLHLNDKDLYKRLSDFIGRVHSFLTNSSSVSPPIIVASLIHYTIIIIVKTVHVFICLRICQKILVTGTISLTPTILKQMEELNSLSAYLERCLLHLEGQVSKVFRFGGKSSDFHLFRDSLRRVSNINYILHYLSGASHKLATILTKKMNSRLKYFNWMAWSIGAVCIGDLTQAFINGQSNEDLIQTCLWSACMGSSSLVLQIPSYESRSIQQLLSYHDSEHRRLCRMFHLHVPNGRAIK